MVFEFVYRSPHAPADVYTLHQEVMDIVFAGGDALNKEETRPLWRAIKSDSGSIVLVRTSVPPLGEVKYREHCAEFSVGAMRRFNCRLNLSRRLRQGHAGHDKPSGTREIALTVKEDIDEWLRLLLDHNGMALQNAAMVSRGRLKVTPHHYINTADLVFNVRITDAERARVAYNRGLGRKKAFGMGLLLSGDPS
ncbi:hypothetical protein GCM10023116_08890 [Kistimonas scapharcae]|uniref:Type I-E CRISPR-associated protein Cas6/Cse3/CasE n=1 Tax=Kistimonas scapharcae TaxID=1036133 RepID=A0ABP8V0I9_9GAMM